MISKRLKDALREYGVMASMLGMPGSSELKDCLLSACEQETDEGFVITVNRILEFIPKIVGWGEQAEKQAEKYVKDLCEILTTDGETYINEDVVRESIHGAKMEWRKSPEVLEWLTKWEEEMKGEHIT